MKTVAVIGASENPDRPSNMACQRLVASGYRTYAVSPHGNDVQGALGVTRLADIVEAIDTVTLYVGPTIQAELMDELLAVRPKRVIFNPGTECASHMTWLRDAGIAVVVACSLVLLSTKQFES